VIKIQKVFKGNKQRKLIKAGDYIFNDFLLQEEGLSLVEEKVIEDGGVFRGQVTRQGERHGYGIQVWPNGNKYEGQWRYD